MTDEIIDDLHRHHHHPEGDKALVIAKFPTAMAIYSFLGVKEIGPSLWWISDDTGAVLSEQFVGYPTEEDAWSGAYLISVLGKTEDDIRVQAFLIWETAGKPDGEALNNWLEAKDVLEG